MFLESAAEISEQFSNVQLKSSISNAELPTTSNNDSNKPNNSVTPKWNPFEDPTPFNQMTEDHIYEAEFDALRDRPNGNILIISNIAAVKNVPSLVAQFLFLSASSNEHT